MNPDTQQMASPEERQRLLDMIEEINGNLHTLEAQGFAGKHQLDKTRADLLQEVFQKLQLAGVDLNDRASVAAFIGELKKNAPLLATQFEEAMGVLLGDIDPSNNMNNQNVKQIVLKG